MSCPFTFAELKTNYPAEPDLAKFFKDMGWDSLINDPNYENTCALRVSVCLVRLGMTFPTGEIKILKGPHKDQRVKIRWNELEAVLVKEWGNPTTIVPPTEETAKDNQGVIVFEKLLSGYPGHIDVWDGKTKTCLYHSYFGAEKVRVFQSKQADSE